MKIQKNVALAQYSTMQLGGEAAFLCEVTSEAELETALQFAIEKKLGIHVVGRGSNTIFSDAGFSGLVVVNKIMGVETSTKKDVLSLSAGAGETWDDLVSQVVDLGFGDIAALSAIPGTVGAAPVQNIGAYGQQISDVLISVRAYDKVKKSFVEILRRNCNFTYRHSRFNQKDSGRFIITKVNLQLSRKNIEPPFYRDVEQYFNAHSINPSTVAPKDLRAAVIAIRANKLPDPSTIPNSGSFFGNPVVSKASFQNLQTEHPSLRAHTTDDGQLKLYAGQLIELAGMKNYHDQATGMATWPQQSLVLVNEHAKTTQDLLNFKQKIIANVQATFGITLTQEPELVGSDTIT